MHEGDCVELVPKLRLGQGEGRGFLIFLDPPWGGLAYKDQEVCELSLSGVPLAQVLATFPLPEPLPEPSREPAP